jgi:hypothetical protein
LNDHLLTLKARCMQHSPTTSAAILRHLFSEFFRSLLFPLCFLLLSMVHSNTRPCRGRSTARLATFGRLFQPASVSPRRCATGSKVARQQASKKQHIRTGITVTDGQRRGNLTATAVSQKSEHVAETLQTTASQTSSRYHRSLVTKLPIDSSAF